MERTELMNLSKEWNELTLKALDLKEIRAEELQDVLKRTYAAFTEFHKSDLVPRELCRIFDEIENFIYFAFLMEDKEVGDDFYCFQKTSCILDAMKQGFFKGKYDCEFPKIKYLNHNCDELIFDFEDDQLKDW